MTDEELKKKCTERAKIFQQAMESCHSSSPMDCIEWFADRIAELEEENANVKETLEGYKKIAKWCDKCDKIADLEKENAELKEKSKRQSKNYKCDVDKLLEENAELKAFKEKCKFNVSDICKDIETEKQLTKAKELLKQFLEAKNGEDTYKAEWEAEQFLNSEVEK